MGLDFFQECLVVINHIFNRIMPVLIHEKNIYKYVIMCVHNMTENERFVVKVNFSCF